MAQAVLFDMKNTYPMVDSTAGSSQHGTSREYSWAILAVPLYQLDFIILPFFCKGLAVGHADGNITIFDMKTATVWLVWCIRI